MGSYGVFWVEWAIFRWEFMNLYALDALASLVIKTKASRGGKYTDRKKVKRQGRKREKERQEKKDKSEGMDTFRGCESAVRFIFLQSGKKGAIRSESTKV